MPQFKGSMSLGHILLAQGRITKQQYEAAMAVQREYPSRPLATILIEQKAITQDEANITSARHEAYKMSPIEEAIHILEEAMGKAPLIEAKARLESAKMLQDAVHRAVVKLKEAQAKEAQAREQK